MTFWNRGCGIAGCPAEKPLPLYGPHPRGGASRILGPLLSKGMVATKKTALGIPILGWYSKGTLHFGRSFAMSTSIPQPSTAAERIPILKDLIGEAQKLLQGPPVSKDAYVIWSRRATDQLASCFGADSPICHQVRRQGMLPTSFCGMSMAEILARLATERRSRLAGMTTLIEATLEKISGQATPIREAAGLAGTSA